MNEADSSRLERLLTEIRDNQKEALALQREHVAIVQKQHERAERINAKAEQIQARSMELVKAGRRTLAVVLPVVVALIAYLSWMIFA